MAIMQVGPGGIETISGALRKPAKSGQHRHGNYVVATHRKAATTNPNCQRIYSWGPGRYDRKTAPSGKEISARNRFAAVRALVAARSHDLMNVSSDQAAFVAQMNTAGGCKTLKQYYWKICGEQYDANHPQS